MDSFTYKLEEMKLLRKEIEFQLTLLNDNERNCVIAFAIIVSFFSSFKFENAQYRDLVAVLPILIAVLGAIRAVGLRHLISVIDSYPLTIESAVNPEETFWVKYYFEKHSRLMAFSRFIFWIVLFTAAVAFASIGAKVIILPSTSLSL